MKSGSPHSPSDHKNTEGSMSKLNWEDQRGRGYNPAEWLVHIEAEPRVRGRKTRERIVAADQPPLPGKQSHRCRNPCLPPSHGPPGITTLRGRSNIPA